MLILGPVPKSNSGSLEEIRPRHGRKRKFQNTLAGAVGRGPAERRGMHPMSPLPQSLTARCKSEAVAIPRQAVAAWATHTEIAVTLKQDRRCATETAAQHKRV